MVSHCGMGICLTALAFYLQILTSYKVMRLLVHTTKLKSSPRQKLCSRTFCDFVNWNSKVSAFCFCKNSKVTSVMPVYKARQLLVGCAAAAKISLLQCHKELSFVFELTTWWRPGSAWMETWFRSLRAGTLQILQSSLRCGRSTSCWNCQGKGRSLRSCSTMAG